jgi:hypothetical protein
MINRKINIITFSILIYKMEYKNDTLTQADIMKTPFIFFQAHKNDYFSMGEQALKGIQEESLLSRVFFSPANYKLLQKIIKIAIAIASQKRYLLQDDQNEEDLTIIMRGMFLQHARHLPVKPKKDSIYFLRDSEENETKSDVNNESYQFFFPLKFKGMKNLFSEQTYYDDSINKYVYQCSMEDNNGKEKITIKGTSKEDIILIGKQIMELNWRVTDDVVPNIISEIRAQELYLRDKLTPYRVIDRPENVSVKGIRGAIPSVTNIYQ